MFQFVVVFLHGCGLRRKMKLHAEEEAHRNLIPSSVRAGHSDSKVPPLSGECFCILSLVIVGVLKVISFVR